METSLSKGLSYTLRKEDPRRRNNVSLSLNAFRAVTSRAVKKLKDKDYPLNDRRPFLCCWP